MAEFREVFDLKRGGIHPIWETFEGFIRRVRSQLSQRSVRFSHGLPVLPNGRLPANRDRFFEIVLETPTNTLGLRIRLHDLYFTHIQRPNSNQWISLENTPDGTGLGYGGRYGDLENNCGSSRQRIQLGQVPLIAAVNQLATNTRRGQMGSDPRACALIVVIEMICESIRFNRISNYFATGVDLLHPRDDHPLSRLNVNDRSFTPPLWMEALQTRWDLLSNMLLVADTNPSYCIPLASLPAELRDIRRFDDLVLTLAVLAYNDVPQPQTNEARNSTPGSSHHYPHDEL